MGSRALYVCLVNTVAIISLVVVVLTRTLLQWICPKGNPTRRLREL